MHLTTQYDFTPWSDRLALDVALIMSGSGDSIKEVLKEHNLTQDDFIRFSADKLFQDRIAEYQKDIKERGLTFKLKAKAQAEELLKTSWSLIHDRDTSPAVKADLIKSTVKWAGLEPTGKELDMGGKSGVSITINLGEAGAIPMQVVSNEPITETIESSKELVDPKNRQN